MIACTFSSCPTCCRIVVARLSRISRSKNTSAGGFSIPAAAWLRGDLEPFARETLSPETIRRQGYLQPDVVTRLIDDHVSGREDLSRQLWGLLAFTLWHERHVEGVTRDVSLESLVA